MSKTLTQIAEQLRDAAKSGTPKKAQLIYGFNGTGKTRLSREFKKLIAPKSEDGEDADAEVAIELARNKILYYSAFTEDLFYWDNDLAMDADYRLKIQPNSFTDWVLQEQGQDQSIITNFQRYVNDKVTPKFNEEYKTKDNNDKEIIVKAFSEVTFSLETGDDSHSGNLKLSKGEESVFIWSIFYALLDQVIEILNVPEPADREKNDFDNLEFVFIDDPVSSLDDNHLIGLAVDVAQRIKTNESQVRFIITTHNPLFFNVLVNELGSDDKTEQYHWKPRWFSKSRLEKSPDGSYELVEQPNDAPFSYHLHLLSLLEEVIANGQIEKYHFNLLRNILEKTATFLGYKRWQHLLPETDNGLPNPYANRIVNFASHSKHAADEVAPLKPEEKKILEVLVKHILSQHRFWQPKAAP
jgi:hypothetical protein